jgi:hypothetical protein
MSTAVFNARSVELGKPERGLDWKNWNPVFF